MGSGEMDSRFAEGTQTGKAPEEKKSGQIDFIAGRRQKLEAEHQPTSDAVRDKAVGDVAGAVIHRRNQETLATRARMAEENRQLEKARKDVKDQQNAN